MSERISDNEDYQIEQVDRGFGGARKTVFKVDGKTGDISATKALVQAKPYTNLSRPNASSLPQGTSIFNTDDNAPNWSDGTNWRDASGNLT